MCAVSVQPTPATLPLPGGLDGATVRVHPLRTATMLAPPGFLQRPSGPLWQLRGLGIHVPKKRWKAIPIPAFLVEHPGAGPILVDTGLHPSVADDPAINLGHLAKATFDITMEHGWDVASQLRMRDIDPEDVQLVVMTHLHFDHASAVSKFPHATFVVDGREWKSASRKGFTSGYRHAHFDQPFDWRSLDFEAPAVDGHVTFGRSIDLLGDGSVRLLATPGHTAGHLSVLLRLGDGRELLLTGDAAYAQRSIDENLLPWTCEDTHDYRRSLGEIRHYLQQTPAAQVICGHDAVSWPDLAPLYE